MIFISVVDEQEKIAVFKHLENYLEKQEAISLSGDESHFACLGFGAGLQRNFGSPANGDLCTKRGLLHCECCCAVKTAFSLITNVKWPYSGWSKVVLLAQPLQDYRRPT